MGQNICGCLLSEGEAGLSKGNVREAHPNYMGVMCGRVIQSSAPFNLAIVPEYFWPSAETKKCSNDLRLSRDSRRN